MEASLLSTLAYYDDNNPLHTSEGNPNLRRLGTHNASVGLRANLPKHQQVVKLNLSYYKKVDPLSSLIQYNTQTGAYHSQTINIRGGEGWNLSSNYTQYFKEAWENRTTWDCVLPPTTPTCSKPKTCRAPCSTANGATT